MRRLTESIELRTHLGDATQDEDLVMAGIEQAEASPCRRDKRCQEYSGVAESLHTGGVKNVICHIASFPSGSTMIRLLVD